jgi:glutathione S-transferase
MQNTLFVINGSHPCVTVEQALALKGVPFRKIEIMPGMQPMMRLIFGGITVPAIRFEDGRRVQGSRAILRVLEDRIPNPRLYGSDEIEEAERWGDEVYQPVPRTILWPALDGHPEVLHAFQAGSKLPALPLAAIKVVGPVILKVERKLNGTDEAKARAAIQELPAQLDKIDDLIARGVLNGESPNAADLQIAPTTRLLHAIADLQPLMAGRPCEAHAFRWLGPNLAEVPTGTLPSDWLPEAKAASAASEAEPVTG